MTKTKTAKALLASVLALVLCLSMLIGTTFAWFTDSVTSANNIIKSGNLDVTMQWADGKTDPANTTWTDASVGAIFNYELWEPGYTEVRHVQIANAGSLALKYQLNILANGEVSDLANVIDVYYVDPAVQVSDRAALVDTYKIGTLSEVLAQVSTTASGELAATESDTITIALKMQETAGNEYQNKSIGSDFSVQLLATQLTAETDSFDNQYDVKATYLNQDADGAWLINNMDELYFFAAQVNSGNSYLGETVKLTADIDLAGYNWVPIGSGDVDGQWIGFNGIFDGQNHTISNLKVTKGGGWNGLFGLVGRGTTGVEESISNLTVKNVVIEGTNRMTGAVVGQIYGNVENCHVENVTITAIPNMTASGYDNGDKIGGVIGWFGDNGNNHHITNCSAKNVTLKAYRDVGGIVGYIGTTTTVEDCAVDTVSITVDQITNHYGDKDANAGGIVGRIYNQPVTIQNNTETNVTVYAPVLVSDADTMVAALEAGEDIVLTDDVKIDPAGMSNAYGTTGINIKNGQTLDGNGHTLDIQGAGGTWDSGINTTGGLIKSLTVTGSFRGIFINHNSAHSEPVVLENVTIDGTTYTISCDQGMNQNLIAENSTFNGWTSYAATLGTAQFTKCSFGEGNGYAFMRPYAPTTYINCEFEEGYTVDPVAEVTFENCTLNGEAITDANLANLVTDTSKATVK